MHTIISVLYLNHQLRQIHSIFDMTTSRDRLSPPKIVGSEPLAKELQTPCRRRMRRGAKPQPGSLYDVLRQHSGLSLYVLPVCWTDLHTRLLDAHFLPLDPILTPVPGLSPGYERRPSATANALCRELNILLGSECSRPFFKTRALKNVLATFYPEAMSNAKTSAELSLYFGGRAYQKAVRIPVLWKSSGDFFNDDSFDSAATRPASSSGKTSNGPGSTERCGRPTSQPIMGYVNRELLAATRKNLYRVIPGPEHGDRKNGPVTGLQRLRSNMLVPANFDEDAHFVGLLIAMAQSVFYTEPKSRSSSQSSNRSGLNLTEEESQPTFHDVKVRLLTIDESTSEFIVYTAVVSATFLRRFAYPAEAVGSCSADEAHSQTTKAARTEGGLDINYVKVPIWPILGLKERLGKALGPEIAGNMPLFDESDPETIEMWESPRDRAQRLDSRKRRRVERGRKALFEVLNSSFEADDDDDDDGDGAFTPHGLGNGAIGADDSPVFSPSAKRRCTRTIHSLEVC